jgi:hypothetical protein
VIHPRTVMLAVAATFAIAATAVPTDAVAQPAAPSDADIEAAKKAFGDGKKAFEAKKYGEAVDKFKESYRLSKRPTLLYNIALALDQNGQKDMALFYYRKFMSDAPADDAQRPLATARTKELETELGPDAGKTEGGTTTPPDGGTTPPDGGTDPVKPPPVVKAPVKIKPAGTYSAADFKHRIVEEAPPGKPLDLTAVVPDDSGFVVTLFFRGSGEAQFTPLPMKWRYNELVGRIPAAKMNAKTTSVQYYIEVKDPAGTVVTKVAKPASPNVVYLEPAASSQFYPDWNPDTATTTAIPPTKPDGTVDTGPRVRPIDDEDPLRKDTNDDPLAIKPGGKRVAMGGRGDGGSGDTTMATGPGQGFTDVGSSKFTYMKWGTTAVGGALLATSVIFYFRAGQLSSTLEGEADLSTDPEVCGAEPPPCREFDDFNQDAQASGKTAETISKVTFGIGIAVAGVAAYYWIKQLRGSAHRERPPETAARGKKKRGTFIAVPALGDGVVGGAAAWSW